MTQAEGTRVREINARQHAIRRESMAQAERSRVREIYARQHAARRELEAESVRDTGLAQQNTIDSFDPMSVTPFTLGPMDKVCAYCGAFGFESEVIRT